MWSTILEVSHNGGTGVAAGASISVTDSEIVDNQDGGAVVYPGGNLDLSSTLVANNPGFAGVVSFGGQLGMDGDTRIVGNDGGGVALSSPGSSLEIGAGPVRVEDNSGDGIAVAGGSALRTGEVTVRNNGGNGIRIGDLSTADVSETSQIVDNGGWGISCEGPPAVAVLGGQVLFFSGTPDLTGNASGPTNCQT